MIAKLWGYKRIIFKSPLGTLLGASFPNTMPLSWMEDVADFEWLSLTERMQGSGLLIIHHWPCGLSCMCKFRWHFCSFMFQLKCCLWLEHPRVAKEAADSLYPVHSQHCRWGQFSHSHHRLSDPCQAVLVTLQQQWALPNNIIYLASDQYDVMLSQVSHKLSQRRDGHYLDERDHFSSHLGPSSGLHPLLHDLQTSVVQCQHWKRL